MAVVGVAFGDRDQAGNSRFGGEQIVVGAVESAVFQIEADGKQSPLRVVEQREVHFERRAIRSAGRPSGIVRGRARRVPRSASKSATNASSQICGPIAPRRRASSPLEIVARKRSSWGARRSGSSHS